MSIIYINLNFEKSINSNIFKYIYGIDFSRKKYRFCIKEIYEMIIEFYHLNLNIFVVNNKIINSDDNSLQLFKNNNTYNNDNKRKNIVQKEF